MRLNDGETTYLYFKAAFDLSEVSLEILLGSAKVQLIRSTDSAVVYEHPCPMNSTHHIQRNIIAFNLEHEMLNQSTVMRAKDIYYTLKIVSSDTL